MLPSSGGFRLNRDALKEAVNLEPSSRRRRASSESTSVFTVTEPSSAQSDNKAAQSSEPEPVAHICVNPQKKGKTRCESCGRLSQEGPGTRDNRSSPPSLGGPAGSGSAVGSFCGNYKRVLPHQWASGKQRQQGFCPGLDQSAAEVRSQTETLFTAASENQRNPSPEVTLCDIAQYCGACSHKCGLLLSDILKTNVVHCFKHTMKPGSQLKPRCLSQCTTEGRASAKNCKFVPQVKSEEHVHPRLDEHEWPHVEMCHLPKGWSTEAAATSHEEYRTGDGEEENAGAEMHRNKRKKLEDGINAGLSTTDLNYSQTPNTSSAGEHRMCGSMSDHSQPSLKVRFGSSSTFGSAVTTRKLTRPFSQIGPEAGRMLSDVFCEGRKVNVDADPESFTCQRVRAYIRTIHVSCARTYMAWPFSNRGSALTANASSTTGPAHRSPADHCGSPSSHTKAPTHPSLPSQARPSEEKQGEKGGGTLDRRNSKLHGCTISYSPDTTQVEHPLPSAGVSTPSQFHVGSFLASSTLIESETSRSTATPHLSPFALSDWSQSSPVTRDGFSSLSMFLLKKGTGVELADAHSTSLLLPQPRPSPLENVQASQASSHFALLSDLDSSQSRDSSLILPQDGDGSSDGSPGKLEPHFKTSPINYNTSTEHCFEPDFGEFTILPFLSPVRSPQRYSERSSPAQSQGCSEEEELSKHKMLPECHVLLIRDYWPQSCYEEESMSECTLSTPSSVRDATHSSQDGTDYEEDAEQGGTSTVLTEPPSSGCEVDEGLLPSASEEAAEAVLDEFAAYEQDVLLVSVIPDDSELFGNLPEQSLLKLGPERFNKEAKPRPAGWVEVLSGHGASTEPKISPVSLNFHWDDLDITEDEEGEESRPWRRQSSKSLATDQETRNMCQPDVSNSHVCRGLERTQPTQTTSSSHDIVPLMAVRHGPSVTNLAEFKWGTSNGYCRQFFSDSLSCVIKTCCFQHLPVDGDEKFCVETVIRFSKNPKCLQKAGAVFTGYYQNNPPGVHFSVPVLMSLLWALLKAGMLSDVFSVLRVSLAYGIVPSYEFLLALFNSVRDKGLTEHVPELMQLIAKMTGSGLDGFNCVKDKLQLKVHPASSASVLSTSETFPEYINLAQSVLEIELCAKQEDWRKMGEVFISLCKFKHHPNQVEQISGRIAVALLAESKDKLSLPFAVFADAVCQGEVHDELVMSFLGRIGVSLMLRYHKTHQWAKGRRVVEVLSMSKVNYSTLKSLFGNENRASRCSLITKAAELLLLSGSVEGALNTLRENKWFLTSSLWPFEPADAESRARVLMRLAEKTSHRDTLEVLCNLPGIQESNGVIDISRYSPLFNSHLQVCVDRQILPVAADTVDLMLSKNLPVDQNLLQLVLHKLGKQKLWLRAREVFRHSLSVGYYQGVSAPTGFMTLMVPCSLGDVELALTLEMFIAVNATAILNVSNSTLTSLSITLKRTQSSESEYLSAGSRLLSAAYIPQPSLTVQYTGVNTSLEQVFLLDMSSARRWLHCNRLWASEMWMQ